MAVFRVWTDKYHINVWTGSIKNKQKLSQWLVPSGDAWHRIESRLKNGAESTDHMVILSKEECGFLLDLLHNFHRLLSCPSWIHKQISDAMVEKSGH